jgi:ABC-type transporter Mla MlaB component
MLKIEFTEDSGGPRLRLEGKVIGPWVEELRRSCERLLAPGATLTLDLSEVSFLDGSGITLLQSLTDRRVRLLNGSTFVAEQLRALEGRR